MPQQQAASQRPTARRIACLLTDRRVKSFCLLALTAVSFLAHRVPGLLMLCFEWSQVDVNLHSVFACETAWRSTRAPADAASAIVELAVNQNLAGFVDHFERRRGYSAAVLHGAGLIRFSGLPLDQKTDGQFATSRLDICLHQ